MKFQHCLLLSVFFASLFISALLLISKPMASEKTAVLTSSSTHMYIMPARHTPREQTTLQQHL